MVGRKFELRMLGDVPSTIPRSNDASTVSSAAAFAQRYIGN